MARGWNIRLFARSPRSSAGSATRRARSTIWRSTAPARPGSARRSMAPRKGLKTVVVERWAVGGQAGSSPKIENYLGFPGGISGAELAERAREQASRFGAEILLDREGVRGEFMPRQGHRLPRGRHQDHRPRVDLRHRRHVPPAGPARTRSASVGRWRLSTAPGQARRRCAGGSTCSWSAAATRRDRPHCISAAIPTRSRWWCARTP